MTLIEDLGRNQIIDNVGLRLTLSEARELRDGLNDLLQSPKDNHVHVANEDFSVELTISIDQPEGSLQAEHRDEEGPN